MWQGWIAVIVVPLARCTNRLSIKLSRWAHELKADPYQKDLLDEIASYAQSIETFCEAPRELASTVRQGQYKEVVECYFMMKRALALAEAYDKTASLQLANEMRNALDHMMRSLISYQDPHKLQQKEDQEIGHLKKMKGHLQRGMLDAVKVTCAYLDEDLDRRHAPFSEKVVGLVHQGEYLKKFTAMQYGAKRLFVKAREEEFQLGTDSGDEAVLSYYLKAIVAYKTLHDYQSENIANLKWARYKIAVYVSLGMCALFSVQVVAELLEKPIVKYVADAIRPLFVAFGWLHE
ncbi:MAG: hypothetical protein AB1513_02840 [Pseudomonadota bacterium]